jgi:hypothetical protein
MSGSSLQLPAMMPDFAIPAFDNLLISKSRAIERRTKENQFMRATHTDANREKMSAC